MFRYVSLLLTGVKNIQRALGLVGIAAVLPHGGIWRGREGAIAHTVGFIGSWSALQGPEERVRARDLGAMAPGRSDLVEFALTMAVAMCGEMAEMVIVHADQGCRYTSAQISRFAREHNLAHSAGRRRALR